MTSTDITKHIKTIKSLIAYWLSEQIFNQSERVVNF